MGGGSKAPAPRDYSKEMTDSLQSQIKLAPELYQAEQQYRPLYTALDMQSLNDTLNGTKASSQTRMVDKQVFGWKNSATGEWVEGDVMPQQRMSSTSGRNGQYQQPVGTWTRSSITRQAPETYTVPEQKGMLDIYQYDIAPRYSEMDNTARAASVAGDMGIISKYGTQVSDAMRSASGNTELLKTLNAQAQAELNAGATLDPSLRREVQQAVRSGQAARGFGYGRNDMASESYMTAMQAEQLRRARQQFGVQMVGVNQATGGDPFMALLGRPSTTQAAQGFGAQAQQTQRSIGNVLFNPESQYAADIYNQDYQAQAASSAGNAANKSALLGAGIGTAGAIGGAVIIAF